MQTPSWVEATRRQFPALSRRISGRHAVYFDGPAGTQVPQRVIDAVSDYLAHRNANHHGAFLTAHESDAILASAHQASADLLGASDPDCIAFGPNMTTLTMALSRALARTWQAGDEILLTRLEHDANFSPWVLAAQDAGVTIQYADIHEADCTLDLDDLKSKINSNTKLVAVGCASNAVGSVNPVKQICQWAREAGALSFLDAVHYVPHAQVNVEDLGCDLLACSAYKFFGPHVGLMWGRRGLLLDLQPYKLRPAPDDLPGRWMTGTQNHECIAGTLAAIDYLADLGRSIAETDGMERREALAAAYQAIGAYESELITQLLNGLAEIEGIRVFGIQDSARVAERLPTVSITFDGWKSRQLAEYLGAAGIFAWDGNYYALPLTERIGVEPDGMVRIGLVHYNTSKEVEYLLDVLRNSNKPASD